MDATVNLTPIELISWLLRRTNKQVSKMKISELQTAWLEEGLPPADICLKDNEDGTVIKLFELGDRTKPKAKKSKSKKR